MVNKICGLPDVSGEYNSGLGFFNFPFLWWVLLKGEFIRVVRFEKGYENLKFDSRVFVAGYISMRL